MCACMDGANVRVLRVSIYSLHNKTLPVAYKFMIVVLIISLTYRQHILMKYHHKLYGNIELEDFTQSTTFASCLDSSVGRALD